MRFNLWIAVALALAPQLGGAGEGLRFETHVRPILKAHCFHCHGEEEKHEAGLDVRLVRGLTKGGESGATLVPGKPEESLLIKRIVAGEMPPGDKKLSAKEQAILRDWVAQGALTARPEPEVIAPGSEWTDEERNFWSLQPIRRPQLPDIGLGARSPLDAFVQDRLRRERLEPAGEADRPTLARRLSFDLLGLPPSPTTIGEFVADANPDAYERLTDRFLASPQYGERWARHWLDVAGYADSDGYTETDPERPWAFRYRDYVIGAFNADKSFDQFLIEQLAGDELLTPPYANLTPDQTNRLAATGFLRMAPDGSAAGGDQMAARNDVVAETLKIVSTSLLGLTVGCAQCHNHRYDPISQVDYYRFRAIFEPALDVEKWRVPAARLVNLWQPAQHERSKQVEAELAAINARRGTALQAIVQEIFERELAKLDPEWQGAARLARETSAKDRTPLQASLLKEYPSLNVDGGSAILYDNKRVTDHNNKYEKLLAEARTKRPADDFVACLTEVPGQIPTTKVFFRGDIQQPRQAVEPGELSVLGERAARIRAKDPQLPSSGRRLALARQLTNGQHPLVGRVLVNRFWMHHFRRGLVATPADFGALGERPTHPELLDWLAVEFAERGWGLKRPQRLMINSATYRQVSHTLSEGSSAPELLSRMPIRRLEAEAIRDAILDVSGSRSGKMYGSAVTVLPDEVGQNAVGIGVRDGNGILIGKAEGLGEEEFRRSIYVQVRRSLPLGVLEPFDAPMTAPNCERRSSSTAASQSLLLMNSDFIVRQAERFARRIESEAGDDSGTQVQLAWRLAFGRAPSSADVAQSNEFLAAQRAVFEPRFAEAPADKKPALPPATQSLAIWCQALLCSNGFLYVD